METYQGVKFNHLQLSPSFTFDQRLTDLNNVAYIFSQLGLTPVHPEGAYGNQSYRTAAKSFIITKSGMTPSEKLNVSNYCEIVGFDPKQNSFTIHGEATPSSESFLHNEIYSALSDVSVILHGHSTLLSEFSSDLNIPQTEHFYDYGTLELAHSALKIAKNGVTFFMLKDHGFVALGSSIQTTGKMVLDYYGQLINLLKIK